ncbi:MAG: hypothetical protein APR55_09980 [Methanolinea sp. SDB]|nr:MAG: hypothetical protein APR55_09980 [Methanolinea sp. SDB]
MPAQNRSPVTEEEAISLQLSLRRRCENRSPIDAGSIQIVAGADAAYTKTRIFGAMVCVSYPEIEIIAESVAEAPVSFPYIPGLFAFRELPVLEACWPGLGKKPDLVIVEGHGYAHPRRFGLASHLGVVLDVPTIGVAKKPLTGEVREPGMERGSVSEIIDGNDVIGMAVRTKQGARPVYVSRGFGTVLDLAVEIVLGLSRDHRMPEPLVLSDRLCRRKRAEWMARQQPS